MRLKLSLKVKTQTELNIDSVTRAKFESVDSLDMKTELGQATLMILVGLGQLD